MNRSTRGALPTRAHAAKTSKQTGGGFVPGMLTGLLCSTLVGILTLVLCALVALQSKDPQALFAPLGIGALALSCLAGGAGVGLRCGGAPLPSAMLCGCSFAGLSLILGLLFGADARQALSLGLGVGASLALRAGTIALFCLSAALTAQVKTKLQAIPRHR